MISSLSGLASQGCRDIQIGNEGLLRVNDDGLTISLGRFQVGHTSSTSETEISYERILGALDSLLYFDIVFPKPTSYRLITKSEQCIIDFSEGDESAGQFVISADPNEASLYKLVENDSSVKEEDRLVLEILSGESLAAHDERNKKKRQDQLDAINNLASMNVETFCSKISYRSAVQQECSESLQGDYFNRKALAACSEYGLSSSKLKCANYIRNKSYTDKEVLDCKGSYGAVCFKNKGSSN